jgi:two-component sensor histidine kinase
MVLTELLQNAVEHGYPEDARTSPGEIVLAVRRTAGTLTVSVDDDGRGLPEGFDLATSTHLGLSIVGTLVESELGGRLALENRPAGPGARAEIVVPLR